MRPLASVVTLLLLALVLAGCGSSAGQGGVTPSATATRAASPTATTSGATAATAGGGCPCPVKVFFSKRPESARDPTAVVAVQRSSPTLAVATFAVQQLIAGPTQAEAATGLYTPLAGALSGPSTCGGPDFTLTANMRGATPQSGAFTLRFCKAVPLAGEVTGAYVTAEVKSTIGQFSGVHTVILLDNDGNCFGDLSGANQCVQ